MKYQEALSRDVIYDAIWPEMINEIRTYAGFLGWDIAEAVSNLLDDVEAHSPSTIESVQELAREIMQAADCEVGILYI